ncbi:MAG: hypothetical protein P1V81_18120 [Planctomycetota bacterium]|nr:hypothetical protein [Planctomycetota bacterium]
MKLTLTLVLAAVLAFGLLQYLPAQAPQHAEASQALGLPATAEGSSGHALPSSKVGPKPIELAPVAGRTGLGSGAAPQAPSAPTQAELLAAVVAYDHWFEGLSERERSTWLRADGFEGLERDVAARLLVDRLEIRPPTPALAGADERLGLAFRDLGRLLELDLLGHAVARFHRRSLLPDEELFQHGVSRLFQHLDRGGLGRGEGTRVVLALSDYLASWRADGHLAGSPGRVLMPLLQAAVGSRELLRETLTLVEEVGQRGVLETSEVMYHVALLAVQLKGHPQRRELLDEQLPWLSAPERSEGMAWGHVELLRAMVSDGILGPDEVSGQAYLPDRLFDREPTVAWAAIELLSSFGNEAGGRRLAGLFHHWLERLRSGDPQLRKKDLGLLLGLATSAPGGLGFEELVPLLADDELGQLVLFALVYLAERDPGDERIGEVWRQALATGDLDPEQRARALELLTQFGFATVAELDGFLLDPELGPQAAMALVALGEVRPGVMRQLALTTDDVVVAGELAKALVRSDPALGEGLARDLLVHPTAQLRNRGAAWLLGMGALAERRGHTDLAESFRAEVRILPAGSLDPEALGLAPGLDQAAVIEAMTTSLLAGGAQLEGAWFAELVPPKPKNP